MSMNETDSSPRSVNGPAVNRLRVNVSGAVQGVGYRPFVYCLATELGLAGWVLNGPAGVQLEVEGPAAQVERFLTRLGAEHPPRAAVRRLEAVILDPVGYREFAIRDSTHLGPPTTLVLPDIATCPDCLREIRDPSNRRYRYPFTNCTHCGPRFSILAALPYDRARTSLHSFAMCPPCRAEYEDPRDRRFHAQPNACPVCGPQLALWDRSGVPLATRDAALRHATRALREGAVVALKGIGGFQLLCDARSPAAVRTLRQRKHREEKPFAVLFPTLAAVQAACIVTPLEVRLLTSPEAPIVLVRRRRQPDLLAAGADTARIAQEVAPGNPHLGAMLPCSPLHHLLSDEVGFPLVATSGNVSGEPICIDEQDAFERLGGIADFWLVHNRPILRQVDDSVARVVLGRDQLLRCGRGYAPLTISRPDAGATVLAVGGHGKNAIALCRHDEIILSQHLGDLDTPRAYGAYRAAMNTLCDLYEHRAVVTACDLHPDYRSTRHVALAHNRVLVQHHHAHAVSCLVDNELSPPALAVVWDGTGLGPDGSIWGGEFLRLTADSFERVAWLRPFRLPGGEQAIREPRRSALGLLFERFGERLFDRDEPLLKLFSSQEQVVLRRALCRGLSAPWTSSAGRLFDAVATLAGLRAVANFEGQVAMELEHAMDDDPAALAPAGGGYPLPLQGQLLDWEPLVDGVLADRGAGVPVELISARFHAALVAGIVAVARAVGEPRVLLSGGCFQNRCLTEATVHSLRAAGLHPYWHQRIPPNDGGLAVGQALVAVRAAVQEEAHVSGGAR